MTASDEALTGMTIKRKRRNRRRLAKVAELEIKETRT